MLFSKTALDFNTESHWVSTPGENGAPAEKSRQIILRFLETTSGIFNGQNCASTEMRPAVTRGIRTESDALAAGKDLEALIDEDNREAALIGKLFTRRYLSDTVLARHGFEPLS